MSDEKESTALSVNLSDRSVADMQDQRNKLNQFIKSSLNDKVDFGVIPGVSKPSLFKPGAEKLCKLFQLGSRIIDRQSVIEIEKNFGMFTYTMEIFHIPTGKAIAQCEGSTNSQEKKYKNRPMVDQINTLQKMAQKRAYVGAVIMATAASDFFTQDVEDMDLEDRQPMREMRSESRPTTTQGRKPSEAQLKRLFAISIGAQWTKEECTVYLKQTFGVDSSKDLDINQYNQACEWIGAHPKTLPTPLTQTMQEAHGDEEDWLKQGDTHL